MFGMFKKKPSEEEPLEYETFVDYISPYPSVDHDGLNVHEHEDPDVHYNEQLKVLMYQLDRIEEKIDQLSINRDENET